ncbi:MAG: hypothetical protein ACRDZ7_05070 [Acidimicrobiia bacterium]
MRWALRDDRGEITPAELDDLVATVAGTLAGGAAPQHPSLRHNAATRANRPRRRSWRFCATPVVAERRHEP